LESNFRETNPDWILVLADTILSEAVIRFLIKRTPFDVITAVWRPASSHESPESHVSEKGNMRCCIEIKLSIWRGHGRRNRCKSS
jgi:hypothetical protein